LLATKLGGPLVHRWLAGIPGITVNLVNQQQILSRRP
jgi:hypothetical protein